MSSPKDWVAYRSIPAQTVIYITITNVLLVQRRYIMEKIYLFLNLGLNQAVEHIVAQEKPEMGKYFFDLACTPDKNGNQLFNIELIIDEDGGWKFNPTVHNEEEFILISIIRINNEGEYSLDYDIVSKKTFEIMKDNESDCFQVEDALAGW